ncbi:hypothetical protein NECID01_1455 [Nematocida sp. AWRm77]|nr:hypothetical protein NECID01_1455 [Nematocida sp. AWRm77]
MGGWLCDKTVNAMLEILACHAPGTHLVGASFCTKHPSRAHPHAASQDAPKCLVFTSFYFESLQARGMESISTWTHGIDTQNVERIVFPVFGHNHWSACVLFVSSRTCLLLDSLVPAHQDMPRILLKHAGIDAVVYCTGTAQQTNGHDCGVYALYFAFCAMKNKMHRAYRKVPEKFIRLVREFEQINFSE